MPSPRRLYTPKELNDLLNASRLPTFDHHPAVGLLVSMALVLEHLYVCCVPDDSEDAEWMIEMAEVLQREVLRGTASVLHHGVPTVEQETVN